MNVEVATDCSSLSDCSVPPELPVLIDAPNDSSNGQAMQVGIAAADVTPSSKKAWRQIKMGVLMGSLVVAVAIIVALSVMLVGITVIPESEETFHNPSILVVAGFALAFLVGFSSCFLRCCLAAYC